MARKQHWRDERGVVLVIVAMCMTVFIGMAALAVDVGSLYQAQRQAQAAADSAALAGAQDLPTSTTQASADATTYGGKGFPGATVTPQSPYNASTSQIHVTVSKTVPTFLGHIFGFASANVSASATATATQRTTTAAAMYATGTTCGNSEGAGIYINPGNISMPDGMVTNAGITMAGTGGVYGPTTFGGPQNCAFAPNSGTTANTFGGAYSPTRSTATVTDPNTFSNFPSPSSACTFSGTGTLIIQNVDNQPIANGTYCYPEIDINSSNLTGSVTFQAAAFQLNGTNEHFTPNYQGLLFYLTGSGSMNVLCNGSNNWLAGGIYAPSGYVYLNGCTGTINSFVEANAITLAGNGPATWHSTLTTTSSGGSTASLTQ